MDYKEFEPTDEQYEAMKERARKRMGEYMEAARNRNLFIALVNDERRRLALELGYTDDAAQTVSN
jgi:hypothetical protein